jgi:AbrB family transcriptional regulator, transcriptional pleiotropic regulator of transition state genes
VKSIGMARKVDDLGRIVLPVELRRQLGVRAGDELDIAVDGSTILLQKIEARCVFCGGDVGLRSYQSKQVCAACVGELSKPAGDGAGQPPAAVGQLSDSSRTASS